MSGESVWALSKGSYSDYTVMCVCPSKKEANALLAKVRAKAEETDSYYGFDGQDVRVEEIPVVTPDVDPVDTLTISQDLWDHGSVSKVTTTERHEWPFDSLYAVRRCGWRWVRAPYHGNKGGRLEVSGTDHEAVRKTFSDMRAQIKAEPAVWSKRKERNS